MLIVLALVLCLGVVSAVNCGQTFSLAQNEFETYNGLDIEVIDINDNSVVIDVDGVTQIFTENSEKKVNVLDLKVNSISDEVSITLMCEGSNIRFAPGEEENATVWVVGILVLLVFFGIMLYLLMRKPKKKKLNRRATKKKTRKKVTKRKVTKKKAKKKVRRKKK